MTRGELKYGGNTVKVWIDDSGEGVTASTYHPKDTMTFRAFSDKYRAEVLPQMKPASQSSITSVIHGLCNTFGNSRLFEIGTEDIQRFVTSNSRASKTVKNEIGVMRMIWTKARAWGYVRTNPFEFLSFPRAPLAEARTLTVDEVRAIVRKTDEPFRTMLWILAETGVRGGELCGLYRSDVDARTIRVARSAFRKQIQTPKTVNAVREIAISGRLASHLSCLISCPPSHLLGAESNLLFAMPDGRPWDGGEIVRRLKPVLGAGVGLHAFRHANKSLMQSLGVPEYIQDERMGHAKSGVGGRYTHSRPEDHRRWAEAIGQEICTENVYSLAMGAD